MAKKKYKPRINRAEEAANMAKNLFDFGGPVTSAEDSYWWGQIPSYMKQNYNPTVAEIGYGNITLPDLNKQIIASNGLANALISPSSIKPITTDLSKIPNKIDVKVGNRSLAEGPLTNQELGIKPKTDWNSVASVASAAMPVVDSVINPKRNTTTAGNIMQGIGGAVSMINPVVGLAIQGAGMLTNAAFGSNIDDSKVKAYETQADAAANTTFGGSTNEQLLSQYQAMTPLDSLNKDDIGSEGWFSNKATNKVNELNKEREAANTRLLANFDLAVNNLEQQNLMYDMANYAKYGGPLFNEFSNGVTKINEGGTHEENPYEGVQVGSDPEGIPNLVEEGELILGPEITKDNSSFVMSDSTKVSRGIRTKYKLRDNITHADAAKEFTKMSEEMPNDPIVRRTKEVQLQELMIDQEQVKMKKDKNKRKNRFDYGGSIARLSPIFLSGGMALNDLLNGYEADQSIFNAQKDAINAANVRVDSSPVKSNIEFTPFDTRSPLIEMSANRAATSRALMNTSGANPAIARTALTNADYNYNNQLGKLWRSIEEAEYNRQLGFEQFRTNLENANRERDLQAQSINADILNKQANLWRTHTSDLYNNERAVESIYSNNLNNFAQNLFDYGTQEERDGIIASLIEAGLLTDLEGKMAYDITANKKKKYGGKIKRKRRFS